MKSFSHHRFQPRLETLDDRLTPSTLIVTSNADSGPGSLRNEIAAATSGDTILFAPNLHVITLTSGELAVNKSLTIKGLVPVGLSISGNDTSRVFHISGSVSVNISGLTVMHGKATGTLAALGTFTDTGSGAGGGGGIFNEAGATLNLSQDAFTGNQAVGAVGYTIAGGAVLNLGTANLQTCGFLNNQAVGGGAFDAIGGSAGGAIANFGGPGGAARLTVTDCTFINNRAVSAGGGTFFGIAGAIENDAGLNGFDPVLAQPSTASITDSAFLHNLATGGPMAVANAGALDNSGLGTAMDVAGSTVNGNRSVGVGGAGAGARGGGLLNAFGTLTLMNCAITNNVAFGGDNGEGEGNGGGIWNALGTLNVVGCTVARNKGIGGDNGPISTDDPFASGSFGGGIQNNFLGVLNISDSVIAGNSVQGGAEATGTGGMAVGGGVSNSPFATMTMKNCVVSHNSAIAGHGGTFNPLPAGLQLGFAAGGGIDISNSGATATVIGSIITDNKAIGGAGGAGTNGGNGYGGGISVGWGVLVGNSSDGSSLTLSNSILANNLAVGGQGGAGADGGNGYGGGLWIGTTSSATISNAPGTQTRIENNAALGGPRGAGGSGGQGIGGGAYVAVGGMFSDDFLTIIAHNFASTSNNDIFP
jgi:hypothetical protein